MEKRSPCMPLASSLVLRPRPKRPTRPSWFTMCRTTYDSAGEFTQYRRNLLGSPRGGTVCSIIYSVVHKNVTVLLSTSLAWPAWAG